MNPRLVVVSGKHVNREIALPFGEFRIGRGEACHLRPGSEQVSREHCLFAVERGRVLLYDMGSFNGTLVNGSRIDDEWILQDGDQVQIGPLLFEFRCDLPSAAFDSSWLCQGATTGGEATPACGESVVVHWLADAEDQQDGRPDSSKETAEMPVFGAPGHAPTVPDCTAPTQSCPASSQPQDEPITCTQEDTSRAAASILARFVAAIRARRARRLKRRVSYFRRDWWSLEAA